ncbi:MAG TPA: dihydrodipicolinate synthase family protein [Enterovirga sp.]|jgi:4-hydroxy-tetrahydrodipicolinate synthase|nr:dihydrodipicolinate synthase family protein [Enterovirga sp.]
MTLTGLSAFPITPCNADGRVDAASLRRVLAPLLAAEVDSIGLLGSTGSYPYLTREERRRALDIALDETAGGRPILVGIGALRTDEAISLAQDAKAAGAAAGLLAPMSYTPLNGDEVFEHFSAVARDSGLPLCIYDNPSTTHFTFTAALIGRLARVPGVIAVKSPAPAGPTVAPHLEALRRAVPDGFSVGASVDWHAADALLAGADAWYSVAGGVFPNVCRRLIRAAQGGDVGEARRIDGTLQPLWALFREFSSLRVVYAALAVLGTCRADPPRPILPLPEPAQRRVADALKLLDLS